MKSIITIKTFEASLSNNIPAMMAAFDKYPYHEIIDVLEERCGTLTKVVIIVMKKRPLYQRIVVWASFQIDKLLTKYHTNPS